jgi:hypothetical protein
MNRRTFMELALCSPVTVGAFGEPKDTAATRPHRRRQGVNVIREASFATDKGLTLLGGATLDHALSHAPDGSGSIRLTTPIPNGSMVFSDLVPVREAAHYTFSLYLRTINGPTYAGAQIALYDVSRRFLRNLTTGRLGCSRDGHWEEAALSFTAPQGTAFVQLQAYKTENTRPGGQVWVDDFYLGEGIGLAQPPTIKRAFRGGQVRVDALGNFEVRNGNRWAPSPCNCLPSAWARARLSCVSLQPGRRSHASRPVLPPVPATSYCFHELKCKDVAKWIVIEWIVEPLHACRMRIP